MLCTKEQFAFSAGAAMFGLPLSSRHCVFLLLRTLLIWNLIIWREVISAFKSFHSHISRVSQNIWKLLLPELQTNKRTGWIDRTWRYRTAVAFLKHKWREHKRWRFDFDRTTCYLYQCHLSPLTSDLQPCVHCVSLTPVTKHRGLETKTCEGAVGPMPRSLSPQQSTSNTSRSHLYHL